MPATDLDQIVNLCKRRGFVYPSAEIYGGFRSSYDYGPLGSLMLRNVREAWIRTMVQERDDVVLIDAAFAFELPGVSAGWVDVFDVETGRTAVVSRDTLAGMADRVRAWQDDIERQARWQAQFIMNEYIRRQPYADTIDFGTRSRALAAWLGQSAPHDRHHFVEVERLG